MRYDHKTIESKRREQWVESGLYRTGEDVEKPKYYILDMFPYPSGAGLHVGHPKGYIATDVFARMKMMQGHNVLHPMGWDAFGLPAENYALEHRVHPREATEKNIVTFKGQLEKLGFTYDWDREINTTDPDYYKWTQWIFLKLFERGLAYESHEPINWCPGCQTGLANEDLEAGKCERCGSEIERKPMRQWVLRITDYAQRLLDDLEKLTDWDDSIREMQRNWIGRSEGSEVDFEISGEKVTVFTTRPDTLFGATYFVLAPEHPLVGKITAPERKKTVEKYIKEAASKSDLERTELEKEKTGVFTGAYAVNPVNNGKIPVWIADYVMMGYGTGAIMAVPAHDARDWEFAKKYGIKMIAVVMRKDQKIGASSPVDQKKALNIATTSVQNSIEQQGAVTCDGISINSGFLDGLETAAAKEKMIEWLEEKKLGKRAINYKLRDWVFSRQRYWGEPMPLVYCEKCKETVEGCKIQDTRTQTNPKSQIPNPKQILRQRRISLGLKNWKFKIGGYEFSRGELSNPGWIADETLPVTLPEVEHYEPTGTGESPLANIGEWVNTKCPKCGGAAKRETNTMPQWAGSSWYYLRYIDPHNDEALVDKEKEKYWSPVDFYVGGAEHATRHLIYARFWHKFLYDIGIVNYDEPFKRLQHVGLILAEDGRKMSKRWGNVINPDDIVEQYGADAMRVYEMFMGPFSQSVAWNTQGLVGVRKFLDKIWNYLFYDFLGIFINEEEREKWFAGKLINDSQQPVRNMLHKTIKKVTEDINGFKFNTAISQLMIFVNTIYKTHEDIDKLERHPIRGQIISAPDFKIFLQLLAPFAPHLAEEIWSMFKDEKDSIFKQPWPEYDPELVRDETINLVVQVNGKLRDTIEVAADIEEEEAKRVAQESAKIRKWTEGKKAVKVIFVPGKLINIVIK